MKPYELEPTLDRVILRVVAPELTRASGIILSQDHDPGKELGEVVAAGPGLRRNKQMQHSELKPGDHVLFSRFNGEDLELSLDDPDEYVLIHESEILAKIPDVDEFKQSDWSAM